MSAKMQVMFTIPRVFGLQNVTQSSVRCKMRKVEVIKRLNKDNKALFGGLMETKKEKVAREKREKKSGSDKESALDFDGSKKQADSLSEVYHIGRLKKDKLLRVKLMGKLLPYYTKKIIKASDAKNLVGLVENSERISTVNNSKSIPDAENTQPEIKRISSYANESKELINLPSNVLINKITLFSYLDSRKKALNNLQDGKIVSISPYSDKTKLSIPSVTRILNKTMSAESKLNLELWKQRMILKLGQEGFEKYSQELLLNGKQFHSSIQNCLIQEPFEVPVSVEKSWQSVQHVLKEVNSVQAIESHVVHSKLYYRGIVDCVAMYRGKLCVIDWKKSDKPKNFIENTFDAPIQVASYIGALNSDSNYNFQVEHGLVVVGYTNGDPASVHEINPTLLNKYWKLWLRRLQQYYLDLTSDK